MNKIHLPMEFTEEEKPLVLQYLQRFKHSQMSLKMLLCAYFGGYKYRDGFISIERYLKWCLRDNIQDNDALMKFWAMDKPGTFFDFSRRTIMQETMNDTEKMITDWFFIERPTYHPERPRI